MIGQVALSLVLLSGAGFLLRGLYRIVTANPGFDSQHVAMAAVDLSLVQYSEEKGRAFFSELLNKLNAMPGVVSASLAGSVPPTEWPGAVSIFHPGEEPPPELLQAREFELGLRVNINHVAPDYFRTLGIPLLQGRDFTNRDRAGAPGVVIVSRKLAEKMWPGENPIGKQISYPRVARTSTASVRSDRRCRRREASRANERCSSSAVRSRFSGIRRTRVGGGAHRVRPARRNRRDSTAPWPPRTSMWLPALRKRARSIPPIHSGSSGWPPAWIGAFSVMALLLAAVGLYAVIAQSVAQRTREVGIRLALGADRGSVAALVIKQGMLLCLAGVSIGFPAAIGFNGSSPALSRRH